MKETEFAEDQKENMIRNWEVTVNLMDDELREEIYGALAPCSKNSFIEAYLAAHQAKFGEEFQI